MSAYEGIEYANSLKGANVKVTLFENEGAFHGFDIIGNNEVTKKAIKSRIEALRNIFYGGSYGEI